MQTMHGVLLVGPYDWEPEVLPEAAFRERLEAFWAELPDASISGAVVYGDTRHNAALVYLTGFTPKVRAAMALVPRSGDPIVLVPGTRAALAAAKRLTWVKNVELLSDPKKAVADWAASLGVSGMPRLALLGGTQMRGPMREGLASQAVLVDATAALATAMARKSPSELAAIRGGCAMLAEAMNALRAAHAAGATVTRAVLEAEHAAHRKGAQDVQSLFSLDGGRTLRPFEELLERTVDPLQTFIAARHAGYWVAGFVAAAKRPSEAGARALDGMIALAREGAASSALAKFAAHPLAAASPVSSVGQAIDEPVQTLRSGGVYALHAGVSDGGHALSSAIVAVRGSGCEVLWRS
jgi:hypothetical protein